MSKPILVGAVVYDPKVAIIWEIIKGFFNAEGLPIDYVFYSNYELQVDASSPATPTSPGTRLSLGWISSGRPVAPAGRSPCATPTVTASPT